MANSGNQSVTRIRNSAKRDEPAVAWLRQPWVWKFGTIAVGLGALFGALWRFWNAEIRSEYPIKYVRIEGPTLYLDDAQFAVAVEPLVQRGILDVDLDAIQAAAKSFAWVDGVRVIRQWPDTLTLQIREHRPAARWNEDSLVSDRGVRFTPPSIAGFEQLPRLYGKEGQEAVVLGAWRKLNELIQVRNWQVTMLSCNFRQSWSARLSDGKELVMGRQDPVASVAYLLKLLPELGDRQTAAMKKVDLRYRNGFAVVWRFEQESESAAPRNDVEPRGLMEVPDAVAPAPFMALNQ